MDGQVFVRRQGWTVCRPASGTQGCPVEFLRNGDRGTDMARDIPVNDNTTVPQETIMVRGRVQAGRRASASCLAFPSSLSADSGDSADPPVEGRGLPTHTTTETSPTTSCP